MKYILAFCDTDRISRNSQTLLPYSCLLKFQMHKLGILLQTLFPVQAQFLISPQRYLSATPTGSHFSLSISSKWSSHFMLSVFHNFILYCFCCNRSALVLVWFLGKKHKISETCGTPFFAQWRFYFYGKHITQNMS